MAVGDVVIEGLLDGMAHDYLGVSTERLSRLPKLTPSLNFDKTYIIFETTIALR